MLVPITLATPSFSVPSLTPTFSTPVTTATGFTVNVTNYDSAVTFTTKTSQGHVLAGVASGATLPLTIQLTSKINRQDHGEN